LVFADDWGRHPSSCQHLVRHLLADHPVHWINTIGTRTPRLDLATLRRGLEKLRHWVRRKRGEPQALPANLRVHNPRMWPWFSSALHRRINRGLLTRQLSRLVATFPEPPVAITTLPIVADLVGRLPVRRWVYYCVDDFGCWPGLDGSSLRQMEEGLVPKVDTLIAVSETLQEKLARMGRAVSLLTHGVDLEFWSRPSLNGTIPQLEGLQRPFVVFWGVIDRRMDVPFVKHLASELTQGTLVLVGPEADPDPALLEDRRIVRLGQLAFQELPILAQQAAVLVMPYADLPVTRAMQPLKLKEYLATGKPVVVRDLPSTRAWADCLDLADNPTTFSQAVRLRLQQELPEEQRKARARLAQESWQEKARAFRDHLLQESGVRGQESGVRNQGAETVLSIAHSTLPTDS
jgi:glycosyltransferase involved in cell wall biosynthesis